MSMTLNFEADHALKVSKNETQNMKKTILEIKEQIRQKKTEKKDYDLVSMVGIGRHCSSFEKGTMDEIDQYIRELRSEWKD